MRKSKKRLASVIMGVTLLATSGFAVTAFTACGDGDEQTPPAHTHTFDMNTWAFDDNHHYHPATCEHKNEELDPAPHTGDKSCSICDWVATEPTVAVTGVSLDVTEKTLDVNGTFILTPTVAPEGATNKAVAWSVTGDAVTVVNGLVTAVKPGEATVTVTTTDGNKTASCVVTVNTPEQTVAATGVSLDVTEKTLVVGGTFTLTPTIAPADATNKAVTWSVTGDAVTVENGLVTAVKPGSATVTVTTDDGSFTATCAVTVNLEKAGWQGGFNETDGTFVAASNGKSELHYYELNGSEKAYAAADCNTISLTYSPGAAADASDAGAADIKLIAKDEYDEEIAVSVRNFYNYMEFLYDGVKLNSVNYRPNGHAHSSWGTTEEQYTLALAIAQNNIQFTVNGATYIIEDTQDFDFTGNVVWYVATDKHVATISDIAVSKTELKSAQTEYNVEGSFIKQSEKDGANDILVLTGASIATTDKMKISSQSGKVGKTNEAVNNTVEFSFRPNSMPVGYSDLNYVAFILEPNSGVKLGIRFLYHWKLAWIQQGTSATAFDWGQTQTLASQKFLPNYDASVDEGWNNTEEWFNVKIEFTAEVIRAYVNDVLSAEAEWHDLTFDENTPCYVETRGNLSSVKGLTLSSTQVAPAKPRGDWKPSGFTAVTDNGETVYSTAGTASTLSYEKEVGNNNTVEFMFKANNLTSWDAWGYLGFSLILKDGGSLITRFVHRNGGQSTAKVDMYRFDGANWVGGAYTDYNAYDRKADGEWQTAKIVFTDIIIRVTVDGKVVMQIDTPDLDYSDPLKVEFRAWCHASVKDIVLSYTNIPYEKLAAYIDEVKDTAEAEYTESTFSAFKTALDAASALTAETAETDIAAAKTALENAFAGLITKAWQNAYDALDAAVKAIDAEYDETEYAEKYTEASLKTFTDALAAAKTALEKTGATETELTSAKTALDDAKNGLIDKTGDIVAVTDVTLNKTELALHVGQTETLVATVAPENATDKVVSWSIEGDAATVEDGVVTAVKPGTATVTVTTRDGEMTATCTVTVTYSAPLWLGDGFNKTGDTDTLYTAKSADENALTYYDVDGTEKKIDISQTNTLSFTYIPGAAPATNQENSYIDICLTDEASHTLVFHIQNYWIYNATYYNGQLVSYFNYANRLHNHGAWGAADAENNISFSFETTSIIININGDNYILHDIYGFDLTKPIKVHFATGSHTPVIKNPTFSSTTPVQSDWTGNGFNEYVENGQTVYTSTSTPTTGARTFTHKNNTLGTNNTVEFGFRPNDWNAWDDWGYIMFAIDTDGHTSLLIRVLYKNGGNPSRIDVYKRVDGTWTSENPLVEGAFDRKATAAIWFESIKFIFTNEKLIAYVDGTKVIDTAMIEGVTITENSTWSIETKINAASIKNVTVSRTDLTETAEQTSAQPQSETAYIKEND